MEEDVFCFRQELVNEGPPMSEDLIIWFEYKCWDGGPFALLQL